MEESELHIVFKHFRPIKGTTIKGTIKEPFHYRRGNTKWKPTLRGGRTQCFIYNDEHRLVAMGETVCSKNDNFCYAEGRSWAKLRAIKNLEESGKWMQHIIQ